MSFEVPFEGSELLFPDPGTYYVYAQIDVAFDIPEHNDHWGRYAEADEANNIWYQKVTVFDPNESGRVYLPVVFRHGP
jgi:hypothetical protein